MIKALARREEELWEWLVERSCAKTPNWFDAGAKWRGWEGWLLDHWPKWLTAGWWCYLLENDGGGRWNRGISWINLWSPITDIYEFRYWVKGQRWRPIWLFQETMPERIICRIKGHPNGEIYYNPGGSEPDHRCQDCGEELG